MTCLSCIDKSYAINGTECLKCSDLFGPACSNCSNDACTYCPYNNNGNSLVDGICYSCDIYDNCQKCNKDGCTACDDNYMVEENKCKSCDRDCKKCNEAGCSECVNGFTLFDKTCYNCNLP